MSDAMQQFEPINAFRCIHCGEICTTEYEDLEEHLDNCERYESSE